MKKNRLYAGLSKLAIAATLVTAISGPVHAANGDIWKGTNKLGSIGNVLLHNRSALFDIILHADQYGYEIDNKIYDVKDVNSKFIANAGKTIDEVQAIAKTELQPERDLVEEGDLVVKSVSAINANYVTVAITAPAKDMLAQEVEVKNGAGVVVPVKTIDIAAGDQTAEFEFVTAVKAADLTGIWTVNGVEYNLDLFNNLTAFLNATDQLKLNAALVALGIQNVDSANMPGYKTAQEAVTKTAEELTVADVQKLVDDVNAASVSAGEETEIVKAVTDAKKAGNAVALLQALQNNVFVRVNPDWVTTATNGYMATLAGTETTITQVQAVIDGQNDVLIPLDADYAITGIDSAKLASTKALIETYASVDANGELSAADKAKLDAIAEQFDVINVLGATTPTALKSRLTVLADLVDDPSILDMVNYIDANGKAYIAKLAGTVDASKDTTTEIAGIISTVNTEEATKLVDAVKTQANAATVDADKLLVALNNLGLKQVASTNKDLYKAETGFKTIADKVAAQVLVDTQNLAAVGAAGETTIIEKLNVFGLDNIVSANAKAYETAKGAIAAVTPDATGDNAKTVALVKAQVKIVNDAVVEAAEVTAINRATTATEVKTALDKLAIASYVNVPSVDKLYIAEQVFAEVEVAQESGDNTLYLDKAAVATALDTATTGIIAEYKTLIGEFAKANLTDTATTVTQLGKLGYDAFDNLTAAEKAIVAEAFVANYPAKEDGTAINYTTLAAVKAAINAVL